MENHVMATPSAEYKTGENISYLYILLSYVLSFFFQDIFGQKGLFHKLDVYHPSSHSLFVII